MTIHCDVARAFADGKTKGRGSRVFIEGDTIYSYGHHFKIAVRWFKGGVDYLFNSKGYSSSTSTHKSYVRSALSGTVLEVKNCDINLAGEQYKENRNKIEELKGKQERARKDWTREACKDKIGWIEAQNKMLAQFAVRKRILDSIGVSDEKEPLS